MRLLALFILMLVSVAPAAMQSADEAPRYALIVGITKFKSPAITKIDGCENSAPLLASTLTESYGFKKENVRTLLNEGATKEAILREFRSHLVDNARAAKKASKEAVILYYFCGHGSQYEDQDGDENDRLDETFVAYDSRSGSVGDILDDELDDLKAELRPWTSNTTLILESCHSGSGSRSAGEDSLIDQETPADKKPHPPYKRKFPPTREDDADTYTEIAASASSKTAKSESKEFCDCEKPYTLMTKALVEALSRASHTTTYRTLGREIAAAVSTRSAQDPQVEGNRDTLVFGGAAKRLKPYIEIERVIDGGQATIRAGKIQGLKVGSQVAIYSSKSVTNSGNDNWLANGVVADLRDFSAVIKFDAKAKVDTASRVMLTSPAFGGGPVLVALDQPAAVKLAADATLSQEIKTQFQKEQLLDNQIVSLVDQRAITPAAARQSGGIVRLRRAKYAAAFPLKFRSAAQVAKPTKCTIENGIVTVENVGQLPADTEIYYLDDGSPGGPPLYGRYFSADASSAPEIARVIRNYALRKNLQTLDNTTSTLPAQVAVSVSQIQTPQLVENCRDGRPERGLKTRPSATDFKPVLNGRIQVGSVFNFKVKNVSGEARRKKDPYAAGEPLYVTAIYLLNNGDINVVYPRLGTQEAIADGVERTFGGYIASRPTGAEHLIVIVSRTYVDFSFYESMSTSRRPQSALERLLSQSGTKSRDSVTLVEDEPNSWGVIRLDLNIVD